MPHKISIFILDSNSIEHELSIDIDLVVVLSKVSINFFAQLNSGLQ